VAWAIAAWLYRKHQPVGVCGIVDAMRTISISVSRDDYEAFRRGSKRLRRSIAQLIREAMALYREERLEQKSRLTELPVLVGHRPFGRLPTRAELYDELFEARGVKR